jgi:hypothetical protein
MPKLWGESAFTKEKDKAAHFGNERIDLHSVLRVSIFFEPLLIDSPPNILWLVRRIRTK